MFGLIWSLLVQRSKPTAANLRDTPNENGGHRGRHFLFSLHALAVQGGVFIRIAIADGSGSRLHGPVSGRRQRLRE